MKPTKQGDRAENGVRRVPEEAEVPVPGIEPTDAGKP